MGISHYLQIFFRYDTFRIVFEKSCHFPVELQHKAYWAIKALNFDLKSVREKRVMQLYELETGDL